MSERGVLPYVVAMLAALAIIALIAYARGEPGDDGRDPGAGAGVELIAV
jgi:hypothetical protein